MKLEQKIILITGGATGIGFSYAKALAPNNTVIICGRRQERLDAACAEVEGLRAIQCDVSDDASVDAMLAKIDADHGGLDVLFNNAGIYGEYDFLRSDDALERLELDVAINLLGPLKLVAKTIKGIDARSGAIVNVSSGLAYVPFAPAPVYSATRAGVHFFTRNLRRQLVGAKIKIFEVLPPMMDTDMVSDVEGMPKMAPDEVAAKSLAAIAKGKEEIPLGMAKQLRFMSRVAPGFIEGQLAKGADKV